MVCSALAQLEERAETHYRNCNLYVTPVIQQRSDDPNTIEIKAPYPCAADEHDA